MVRVPGAAEETFAPVVVAAPEEDIQVLEEQQELTTEEVAIIGAVENEIIAEDLGSIAVAIQTQQKSEETLVKDLAKAVLVKEILGEKLAEEIATATTGIADAPIVQDIVDTGIVKDIVDTAIVEDIVDTAIVKDIVDTAIVQDIVDTAIVQDIVDTAIVEQEIDRAIVQEISEKAAVEEIIEKEIVGKLVEIDSASTVNSNLNEIESGINTGNNIADEPSTSVVVPPTAPAVVEFIDHGTHHTHFPNAMSQVMAMLLQTARKLMMMEIAEEEKAHKVDEVATAEVIDPEESILPAATEEKQLTTDTADAAAAEAVAAETEIVENEHELETKTEIKAFEEFEPIDVLESEPINVAETKPTEIVQIRFEPKHIDVQESTLGIASVPNAVVRDSPNELFKSLSAKVIEPEATELVESDQTEVAVSEPIKLIKSEQTKKEVESESADVVEIVQTPVIETEPAIVVENEVAEIKATEGIEEANHEEIAIEAKSLTSQTIVEEVVVDDDIPHVAEEEIINETVVSTEIPEIFTDSIVEEKIVEDASPVPVIQQEIVDQEPIITAEDELANVGKTVEDRRVVEIEIESTSPIISESQVVSASVPVVPESKVVSAAVHVVPETHEIVHSLASPVQIVAAPVDVPTVISSTKQAPRPALQNLIVGRRGGVVYETSHFGSSVSPHNFIIGQPVRIPKFNSRPLPLIPAQTNPLTLVQPQFRQFLFPGDSPEDLATKINFFTFRSATNGRSAGIVDTASSPTDVAAAA